MKINKNTKFCGNTNSILPHLPAIFFLCTSYLRSIESAVLQATSFPAWSAKKEVGSFWSVLFVISSAYEIHTHLFYVTGWITFLALTRLPREIWQITEASLHGVTVMISNKCLENKLISVHVSNLQHLPLLPLSSAILFCTGLHRLIYWLTNLMNYHIEVFPLGERV